MESLDNVKVQIKQDQKQGIIVFKRIDDLGIDDLAYYKNLVTTPGSWLVRESRNRGMVSVTFLSKTSGLAAHMRFGFDVKANKWRNITDKELEQHLPEQIDGSKIATAFDQLMELIKSDKTNAFDEENLVIPSAEDRSELAEFNQYLVKTIKNSPVDALKAIATELNSQINLLKTTKVSPTDNVKSDDIVSDLKELASWLDKQPKRTNFDPVSLRADLEDPISFEWFVDPLMLENGTVLDRENCYVGGKLLTECPKTRAKLTSTVEPIPVPHYQEQLTTCVNLYHQLVLCEKASIKAAISSTPVVKKPTIPVIRALDEIISQAIDVQSYTDKKNQKVNYKVYFNSKEEGKTFAQELFNLGIGSLQLPGQPKVAQAEGKKWVVHLTTRDSIKLKEQAGESVVELELLYKKNSKEAFADTKKPVSIASDHNTFFKATLASKNWSELPVSLQKQITINITDTLEECFGGMLSCAIYWDTHCGPDEKQEMISQAEKQLSSKPKPKLG